MEGWFNMKISVLVDKMGNVVGSSQIGIVKVHDGIEIEMGIIAGPEQSSHEIEIDDDLIKGNNDKFQQILSAKLGNLPGQTLKKLTKDQTRPNLRDKESHPPLIGVHPQISKKIPMEIAELETPARGQYPDFVYHHGPVINTPQAYLLFVGDWSSAAKQNRAHRLAQFNTDLLSSQYMNILSQYGCGTSGTVVNSVYVSNSNPSLSGQDINNILQTAINNHQIPEPTNPSNVHILYLDDNTMVDDVDLSVVMCEAINDNAFGFHYFFTTTAGNACMYAVVPGLNDTCLEETCPNDSTCSLHRAETREQRQTQVTSHELSEMISDPQLNAWWSPTVSENGDICNGQSSTITVGSNTWTVQKMYSKWHDMNTNNGIACITSNPNPLPDIRNQF